MKIIEAKAKLFGERAPRLHKFMVDADRTIRVWDDVAKHYTRCYTLPKHAVARLVRKAKEVE
jgi:hypothetical protein